MDSHSLALSAGMASGILFFIVYIPQILLNIQKKSTGGLSLTSMFIKISGGGFMLINCMLVGEAFPVQVSGALSFLIYSMLIMQIARYNNRMNLALIPLSFVMVPYLLGSLFPSTIPLTNLIKPSTQIFSHLAQLLLFYQRKTVKGYALDGQHFNFLGAACGSYMCLVIPPKSSSTWMLYINSFLQAFSVYLFVLYYDGAEEFLKRSAMTRSLLPYLPASLRTGTLNKSKVDVHEKDDVSGEGEGDYVMVKKTTSKTSVKRRKKASKVVE